MDQRKASEQVFHDEAFSTNTRGRLSKYYAISELRQLKAHFSNVEVRMFHLFTLLAVPFRKFPGFQLLVRLLATADRGLFFLLPFLRRYAWKVVLVLSKPVKS